MEVLLLLVLPLMAFMQDAFFLAWCVSKITEIVWTCKNDRNF